MSKAGGLKWASEVRAEGVVVGAAPLDGPRFGVAAPFVPACDCASAFPTFFTVDRFAAFLLFFGAFGLVGGGMISRFPRLGLLVAFARGSSLVSPSLNVPPPLLRALSIRPHPQHIPDPAHLCERSSPAPKPAAPPFASR